MSADITVVVCGAAGRMGREVVRAVLEADGLKLVGAVDLACAGADSGELTGVGTCGIKVETSLEKCLTQNHPDVMIDFTLPEGLMSNIRTALGHRVSPVVGTTGLSAPDLEEIETLANNAGVGAFIAPNFAIGAVLMMQFAAAAAKYMPDVEIIELHHDRKLDSPSGTALLTAKRIAASRAQSGVAPTQVPTDLIEKSPGARGSRTELTGDVPIHSVRLQGFVAHQEVIFGGPGQVLTIRHDSIDRKSFMPGVVLAVRKVKELHGLTVGLENVMN